MTDYNLILKSGRFYVQGLPADPADIEPGKDLLLIVRYPEGDVDTIAAPGEHMHSALYDLRQTVEGLKDGDRFLIDGVPAYVVDSFHVVPAPTVGTPGHWAKSYSAHVARHVDEANAPLPPPTTTPSGLTVRHDRFLPFVRKDDMRGRQAIITKYLGPTDRKPARISAHCEARRIIVTWDHGLNVEDNHAAAAVELAGQLGWPGEWLQGGIGAGYCFIRASD